MQNVFKFARDCKMILHFQKMNWVKILIVHSGKYGIYVQILYRIKKKINTVKILCMCGKEKRSQLQFTKLQFHGKYEYA